MNVFRNIFKITKPNIIRNVLLKLVALLMIFSGIRATIKTNIIDKIAPLLKDSGELFEAKTVYAAQKTETIAHGGNNNYDNNESFSQTAVEQGETLDEYLSRIVCTGCGNRCSLLSPRCGKGQNQAQSATAYYEEQTNSSSTSSDDNQSVTQEDSTESVSLSDYLGKLYCTGCDRHCSLLSPSCAKGELQANQATEEYNEEYATGDEDQQTSISVSSDSEEDVFSNIFLDLLPTMGMYIAGTYYIVKFLDRKSK